MFASRTQRRRSAQAWPFPARHHGGSPRGPGPGARRRQSRYLRRPPREPGPGAQRRHSRYRDVHNDGPAQALGAGRVVTCDGPGFAVISPRGSAAATALPPPSRPRTTCRLAFLVPRTAAVRWKVISSFRAQQRSDGGSGVSSHSSFRAQQRSDGRSSPRSAHRSGPTEVLACPRIPAHGLSEALHPHLTGAATSKSKGAGQAQSERTDMDSLQPGAAPGPPSGVHIASPRSGVHGPT